MPFSRAFFPVFSRDIFNSKVVSFVTFLVLSALFFSPLSPFAIEQPAEAASAHSGTCEQSLASASNVEVLDIYTNGKVTECRVKFTAGTNSWTVPQGVTSVKVLVVGGGGGGGTHVGGGGGGGAVYENLAYGVTPLSNISVTVGAGGTGAVSSAPYCVSAWAYTGGTSTFGGTNVLGGGHGASWEWQYAGTGANGGGGSSSKFGEAWFDGAQGQASTGWSGYKGGNAPDRTMSHSYGYPTGGGAGATSNGSDAQGLASGSGGAGKYSEITGTYFGGGGGGGFHGGLTDGRVTIAGSGGIGGGGAGNGSTNGTSPGKATSGAANTGGGGGGSGAPCGNLSNNVVYSEGGNGGSGVVIVQYSVPNPVNTARPTVAGSANVGSYLQASQGTWSNPITKLTYQWQASTDQNLWVDIVGATSNSYKLTSNEANKYMRVVVFATNQYGTSDATSVGTGQVNGTSSDACAQTVTNSSTIQVTEIATSGGGIDCVVKFTSGTNTWTKPAGASSARLLIVGGGGAGGAGIGGGGGAGEMVEVSSLTLDQSTYSVTVGGGGLTVAGSGPAGSNSSFSTITAYGGGGGGYNESFGSTPPQGFGGNLYGSSGGGAYPHTSWTGATRVYGVQDNTNRGLPSGVYAHRSNGGFGSGGGGDFATSGGGGGAGSGGGAALYNEQTGGDGGPGRASDITGVAQLYAAGGGGGINGDSGALSRGVPGNGGSAIGGSGGGKSPNCVNRDGVTKSGPGVGCIGFSAVANTGSGGGGGSNAPFGGDGGSGVVILRYSLAAQTALTVSPTTTTYGSTQTLSTSGGSGSGAVTYTVSDTGTALCSISGATLSFTAAGTCKVTAAKATGGGYLPTTSLATTVTVGTASMGTVATPTVTATSGVANSIDVSWSSVTNADRYYVKLFNSAGTTELFQKTVSSGTSTTITASDYASITSAQSYKVSVGAASSTGNYSLGAQSTQVAVTVNIAQAALSISTTTATFGSTRTLSTTGGSGTGAVSYQVTTVGTANCSVSGTTLSYTHAGTCSVTATKAAQGSYLAVSSAATTITVNPANMGTVSTPTVVATSGVANSIDVSWTAVTNADRYQVKLFRADTDVLVGYAFVDNATSYTITSADYNDITNLRNYKVTVAAYSSTGDYAEGTPSTSVSVTTNISATVTYSYNGATGGNSTTSRTLITGTSLTLPTPTKTGYTFTGWYSANSGGTKVGDGGASYTPSDSVTLYAIWANNLMAYEPFTGTAGSSMSGGAGSGSSGMTGNWTLVKAEKQGSALAVSHSYTSIPGLKFPANSSFSLPSSNTGAHGTGWNLSYTAKQLTTPISFDSAGTYYYSFINHVPTTSSYYGFGMLGLLSGLPSSSSDVAPWSLLTGSPYGATFGIDYGNANRSAWVDGQTRNSANTYSALGTKTSAPTTEATANFVVVKIVTSASGNDQISLRAFAPSETLPTDPSSITWDVQYGTAITGSARYLAVQTEWYGAFDEFRIGYTYDSVTGALPVYTVTYNYNSATGGNSTTSADYISGKTALTLPTPTRTGYTFAGWYSEAALTNQIGLAGDSYTPSESGTVYAKWTKNSNTVTFNPNGATGTSTTQSVLTDTATALIANTFVRQGYMFSGWDTVALGGGNSYTDGQSVTISGPLNLYAQWAGEIYTVTYNYNGATSGNTSASNNFTYGGAGITLPTPTKTGYTFSGWYENSSFTGSALSGTYSPSASGTIYAKWTSSSFTVTWDSNGGSTVTGSSSFVTGDTIALPTAPTKAGKYFVGWSTTETANQGDVANKITSWPYSPSAANKTFYAIWYDDNSLNLGGSAAASARVGANSTSVNVVPRDSSYTWEAWIYPTGFVGTGTTKWGSVLDNGDSGDNYGRSWLQIMNTGSGPYLSGAYWIASSQGAAAETTANSIVLNKWQHVAMTVTRSTSACNTNGTVYIALYIDGVKRVEASDTAFMGCSASTGLIVGDNYDDANQYFKGKIDQVKIWDGNLTEAEIAASRSTYSNAGVDNTLRAHYDFNDLGATPALNDVVDNVASSATTYNLSIYGASSADVTSNVSRSQNQFQITYDPNTATSGTTTTQSSLTPYTALSTPGAGDLVRTGYSFGGWNTTTTGSGINFLASDTYTLLYGDQTLYSNWTANSNTVTFDANGGTGTMANQTITSGTATALTANSFTRTGYTFAGWATTSTGAVAYANSASVTITAGMDLFAKWTANSNTVTFNANGGSGTMANQSITSDAATALTTNSFSRTGYTFAGWATTSGGNVAYVNSASVTITAGMDLFAKWTANTNTVTFNANGGTGTMANQSITSDAATTLTANTFTKTGYTFAGWATSAGGAVAYANSASVTITSGMDLYAKWTANTNTVTFDANGGSGTMANQSITSDVASALTANAFTKTGYTFAGWATSANGSVVHANSASVTITSGMSLYAKWTANTYTVTYNYNGATGSNTTVSDNYTVDATTITLPVPTKTGYTFNGWFVSSSFTGSAIGSTYSPTSSVTVYAKWTANTYTIAFNYNGATGSNTTLSDTYTVDGTAMTLPVPTKTGYSFAGWFASSSFTGSALGSTYSPAASGTIYAKWTAGTNTIAFDSNGGAGSMTSQSVTSDVSTALTSNSFSKTGYTFAGWATSAGGAVAYADGASVTTTTGFTLYAKWTANTYTVTYNYNGADGANSTATSSYTVDAMAVTLPVPTKTGYAFAGWYESSSFTGSALSATYAPTSSRTIYAKWSGNANTVTFNANDGSGTPATSTQSVVSGVTTNLSANTFTRTGYTFARWTTVPNGTGNGYIDQDQVTLTGNLTLYAQWEGNTYTVTYNYDNATGSNADATGTYTVGGTALTLPIPTRTGYTFAGWYESANFTGSALSSTYSPASSRTIYAKWNQIMCAPIISTALGYTVYTFSNVGTCEWSVPNGVTNVQALVVAGGGGGGYSWDSTGAGGGAGGQVKTGMLSLGSSVTVTVGQGGSGGVTGARNGTAGQSSSVSNISALGGNGGCSGRATCANSGTPATANAAAIGGSGGSGGQNGKGGGGSDTTGSVTNSTAGGAGISSSYSGLAVIYGAGGAGGTNRTGAWNIPGTPGPANTGRGGGGASAMGTSGPVNGGAGGSGLVILRVANTYSVTYDSSNADSGTPSATSTSYTTDATPITLPTQNTLSRAGYTFAGWSTTQNDSSTRVTNSGSYTVSANSTLYALWTAINYSVTYSSLNSDAGTVPTDSTNYNIGNTVAIQANTGNLSRTGYTFGGWVLNSDGSGTVYQSGGSYTIGTSSITLYPKWIANTYTVTYNANGASGSPSRTSDSYTSGTAGLSLPNVGTMLKTGYDFAGWSTSPSGSALSGAFTTSSNVTLYAVWTLKQINYNYHRGNAGGTNVTGSHAATSPNLNAQVGLYGSVINLDNTISRNISVNSASYQFMGWNDGNSIFAPNDAYTLGESGRTFTAEWVRIFEVRYGLNGGTGIIDVDPECTQGSNTCLDGQNITLSAAPTRAGYTFAGWKDQSGQLKNAGASTSVTSSSYLYYAQWDAIDYTISFNSAGGSDDHADQIKNIGDSLLMPNPGTKAGHTFAGWFDGSGNTLGAGAAYTVGASGKTFVALWTPQVYTVSYNWNGGLGAATNNVAYTYGTSAITLPSGTGHSRDGFDFTGWATTPGGAPVGSTFVPTQDTMLYAVWADGHYSVNLNAHGGSVGQISFTVPRGDDITLPTPTRAGFVFDGWFESLSSSTRVGHGQSAFTPAASRTLHAKWVQNSLYGINPAHINSLTSITVTGSHSWSGTHSASGTGAALNIPNGALASGTQVQVSFIEDMTRPRDLIDNNYAYYTSVVLHWLSGSGDNATVPVTAANKPLTLTLTNPAILPGAKVFMILNGVATEVAEATQEGEVTINVTQDPEFVIAATPPRSPASVTATQVTNSAATVSWTAPASTGGSPITGYTVTASPGGATCVTTTELSCEIRGLSSGVSYSYSVVAENALGSSTVRSTTIAYVAPPVVATPINVVPAGNSGTVTGVSGSLASTQSEDVTVESAETLGKESEDINPASPESDSDTKAQENQATEVESPNNLTGYVTAGGLLLLLVIALAMYFIQRARKKVNP